MLRDWTDSVKFDGITAEVERLFLRLIMKADDYGRFHAEPRLIKAACYPLIDTLRTNDLSRWLDELSNRQLILRYEAERRKLLAIVNYGQRLKRSRAKFPPLEGESEDWLPVSGMFPEVPGSSRNFREVGEEFPPEEKGREEEVEGKRREGKSTPSCRNRGTLEEVIAFTVELGLPASDGEAAFHKWDGNGWVNGGNKIKDWKSTIRSWKAAGYHPSQKAEAARQPSLFPSSAPNQPLGHRPFSVTRADQLPADDSEDETPDPIPF